MNYLRELLPDNFNLNFSYFTEALTSITNQIGAITDNLVFKILALLIAYYLLALVVRECSKHDWFFTMVQEARAKAKMAGGGDGAFQTILYTYKDHIMVRPPSIFTNNKLWKFNFAKEYTWTDGTGDIQRHRLDTWDILSLDFLDKEILPHMRNGEKTLYLTLKYAKRFSSLFAKISGLYGIHWLGWPGLNTVYKYKFRWSALRQSKANDKTIAAGGGIYFEPHEEPLDYILLQPDIYYARVEDSEDKNMVPIEMDTTIRMHCVNPYKALFNVQDWLENIWGIYLPDVRLFGANNEWSKLNKGTRKMARKFRASPDVQSNEFRIWDETGIVIDQFRFLRISPSGDLKTKYEEAATAEYFANQQKKKTIIDAEAQSRRYELEYGKLKELGVDAMEIRKIEAFEKVGESGKLVIAVPSDLLSSIKEIAEQAVK